jgi:hypothetical protein
LSSDTPVMRAHSDSDSLLAATAASKPLVRAAMKALSCQPCSTTWVSSPLKSAMSVPGCRSRCSTLALPATDSATDKETVRRGSMKMIFAGPTASLPNSFFFLSTVPPCRLGSQWLRK